MRHRLKVITCKGNLSSKTYYAIMVDGKYILELSDRHYSRMLEERTGDIEADHGHYKAREFFTDIVSDCIVKSARINRDAARQIRSELGKGCIVLTEHGAYIGEKS